MEDKTLLAKTKIKDWAKEAIQLEDEYECAINMAARHESVYNSGGEDTERKNTIRWLAKAWKATKRIIAIKESIHWEASALEKFQLSMLETKQPLRSTEVHAIQADANYFGGISQKAVSERDAYIEHRKDVIANIRKLRTLSQATAAV